MTKDSNSNLFDNLAGFGLDNLDEISVYEEKEDPKKGIKDCVQVNPASFVYERKVDCPVCGRHIQVRAVKTSGVRILSKDSDFMVYYQEPNPSFYDAWLCTYCGYASLSNKFNTVSDKQKKLIRDNITPKWKFEKTYPHLYDVDTAIEIHQIALLNSIVKQAKDSEKAMICLKIAWLHRIKNNPEGENKFLNQAQQGFLKALEKEDFPVVGLDQASLQYLIGELYRRLSDPSNALLWFGRVLASRNATPKIKDMARTQKDLIYSTAQK
ncbi:MAG: DUF2225 domain-containing protein [Clostridia bacterium]|nr:DUF2225 domain-containing protein [Clostridia bacterium]